MVAIPLLTEQVNPYPPGTLGRRTDIERQRARDIYLRSLGRFPQERPGIDPTALAAWLTAQQNPYAAPSPRPQGLMGVAQVIDQAGDAPPPPPPPLPLPVITPELLRALVQPAAIPVAPLPRQVSVAPQPIVPAEPRQISERLQGPRPPRPRPRVSRQPAKARRVPPRSPRAVSRASGPRVN